MKGHPIFEKKRQEALGKIFDFKFIRTNPSKENYDVFFETGRTQTSISELKKKKLEEEINDLKEKISC